MNDKSSVVHVFESKPVYRIINDLALITLALLSMFLLVFEITRETTREQLVLIHNIDLGIAFIFLIEFMVRLILANEKGVFFRKNWWQLLAAVPVTTVATQAMRGLMFLRIVQIVRFTSIGARLKILSRSSSRFLNETQLPAIATFLIFVILIGSVSFFLFEVEVNPNVATYYDSFWYATGVITNSGSSDVYPLTKEGRAAGIFLMFSGAATFGVLTAFLASYLIRRHKITK